MGFASTRQTDVASRGSRPQVLALPSPTISRFVLLVTALLSAGLFVGMWLHLQTSAGTDWVERIRECETLRPPVTTDSDEADVQQSEQWFLECTRGAQEGLAWFALAGVGATLVAGAAVLLAVPSVVRRRRGLRPAGPHLAAASSRLADLAREAGVRVVPQTMVGSSKQRDAFSFGLPGRYAIALPPALAVRSAGPAFEPVVRHELAHVARHDVFLAWSARALWFVVAALLVLPVVSAIVRLDASLLPSYAWRAALLLLATSLASAGVLRSREYDADLSSADTEPRRAALHALLRTSARGPATGWRRVFALHPSVDDRAGTLDDPARLARPSWIDAGLAAFFAALVLPLLVSVFDTVPAVTLWAYAVPATLLGALMGATVGLGLWRLAVVDRVVGGRSTVRSAALRLSGGVLIGYLLGGAASLAEVGRPEGYGWPALPLVLVGGLAMAGATFVVAGLAMLAADRAHSFSIRRYTSASVVMSGTLFAVVLWAATTVTRAADLGLAITGRAIQELLTDPAAAVVVLLLAVAVLLLILIRPSPAPPAWAVDGDMVAPQTAAESAPRLGTTLVSGLVAGCVAALSMLIFRIAAGPAPDLDEAAQRFDTYVWVIPGAGAAASVSLIVLYGVRAAGAGLLAGPAASIAAAVGFLAINTAYGGPLIAELVVVVLLAGLTLGITLVVIVSTLAAVPMPRPTAGRPMWLVVIVTALVGSIVAAGTLVARDTFTAPAPVVAVGMTVDEYVRDYVPTVETRVVELDQAVAAIDADVAAAPDERAQRVRVEIVGPLLLLRRQADRLDIQDEALGEAHGLLVDGLESLSLAYQTFALAYETGDGNLFTTAAVERDWGLIQVQEWRSAIAGLSADSP